MRMANTDAKCLTLVSRGFGNIIEPRHPEHLCQSWRQVPSGRHYLTATVELLEQRSARHGKVKGCWILLDGIYWLPTSPLCFDCPQQDHDALKRCRHRPQQILFGRATQPMSTRTPRIEVPSAGAIIFGLS